MLTYPQSHLKPQMANLRNYDKFEEFLVWLEMPNHTQL